MVLPDGAPAEPDRPSAGRRLVFVGAAAALLVGALTLGALTTPDPSAAEPTSTSTTSTTEALDRPVDLEDFSVSQIAVGEPLDWSLAAEIEGSWPAQLVSHEDTLFLFTSEEINQNGRPAGYRAYSSVDGSNWSDLGPRIPTDGLISSVASTPFGLVAVETGTPDGSLRAWFSSDGVKWARSDIDHLGGFGFDVGGPFMGSNGDVLVIAGTPFPDPTLLLEEKLREIGLDLDLERVDWGVAPRGEDWIVTVHGPLGIAAMEIPVSELNLSSEEQSSLVGVYEEQKVLAWATDDGVEWVDSTVEGGWVESVIPGTSGDILLFGDRTQGGTTWRTYDGAIWERVPGASSIRRAVPWRDGLLGLSGTGTADVMTSSDGEEWESLGLADRFPSRISWYATDLGANDPGIAVWVTGYQPYPGSRSSDLPVPVLVHDGVRLSLDLESGSIDLEYGTESRTWRMWSPAMQDDVAVDLVAETVTFLDVDQNPIVTFTFEELEGVERAFQTSRAGSDLSHDALAFTTDGRDWSIQDLNADFGGNVLVMDLQMTVDSLVAVVAPSFDAYLDAELQIWTAPLP